jgi:tight adherence protein C
MHQLLPQNWIEWLAFLAGGALVLLLYQRLEEVLRKARIDRRFRWIYGRQRSALEDRIAAARRLLVRLGEAAAPRQAAELAPIRRQLSHAGFRAAGAVALYYGARMALALLLGALVLLIYTLIGFWNTKTLLYLFVPLALGYYLPAALLRSLRERRLQQIFRELPDALDLLLICMEAGLSFDMALERVSRELKGIAPVLSAEFRQYFMEIKSGLPRQQVLEALAERNGEKGLASVVQVLIQSARTGTDIAESLNIYAESMRTSRRQQAEEQGAKVSAKLTFPTVLLILPALMLIILGPAAINLLERLGG